MILVTGGAGFIGSNFVLEWCEHEDASVTVLDKLTYAGNRDNLAQAERQPGFRFQMGDIGDADLVRRLLERTRPRAIVHFAAESHVDRSIKGPGEFIRTNVNGTQVLLDAALEFWRSATAHERDAFRFLHVSTDEVYGSLSADDAPFTEHHPYQPNSPYAASKAAADHLVRAYHHTYGLPTITTNCSNNYGPLQFPEKLIPLMILNGLEGRTLPIYGDGLNVRDWLFVSDHCTALRTILARGRCGATYNIGGDQERTNIDVVGDICTLLDELRPTTAPHDQLIRYVPDRPGHDRRYAIDSSKLKSELGWQPREDFASGLRRTVTWYLEHGAWTERIRSGAYRAWIEEQYA